VGDHFLGTRFLLPIGIVLGAALGVFVIIRRFGTVPAEDKTEDRR
jgi:ATP synthase protein I